MVSLLLGAPAYEVSKTRERMGKPLPAPLRRTFGVECPGGNGDNCLLTLDFAFIDLAFSRLLA